MAMMRSIDEIRPGCGILVVDCQGNGDVVCSLPLLKAIESGSEKQLSCICIVSKSGAF